MGRVARHVVAGAPHHITQRGNNRQRTFFDAGDYETYLHYAASEFRNAGVDILAWCLMPNHIHMIATPHREDSLGQAVGRTHLRYARRLNAVRTTTGHLWQGRFASSVMHEDYLANAVRYVIQNPVRAGLAATPVDWRWSSARFHLLGWPDPLVRETAPDRSPALPQTLTDPLGADILAFIRDACSTCRPLGGPDWIRNLELASGRRLARRYRLQTTRMDNGDRYNCRPE